MRHLLDDKFSNKHDIDRVEDLDEQLPEYEIIDKNDIIETLNVENLQQNYDLPIKLLNIKAKKIIATSYHSALLTESGEVYHWGLLANIVNEAPNKIKILKKNGETTEELKIIDIGLGGNFLVILGEDNQLYTMGRGMYGVLGHGVGDENKDHLEGPLLMKSKVLDKNMKIKSIACGYEHCLVATDRGLYGWGRNDKGQLGVGQGVKGDESEDEIQYFTQPKLVVAPKDVEFGDLKKVCSGSTHSMALTKNGRLYSWGNGYFGALGHSDNLNQLAPKLVNTINSEIMDIACGGDHSLALTRDGELYGFGWNGMGQLGIGGNDTQSNQLDPKLVDLQSILVDDKIKSIHAGDYATSFFITTNGDVYSFGMGEQGCLGNGKADNLFNPTKIQSLSNVKSISAGFKHTLSLNENDEIFVFGDNTFGQLGSKNNNIVEEEENDVEVQQQLEEQSGGPMISEYSSTNHPAAGKEEQDAIFEFLKKKKKKLLG
eukprot:gene3660-4558_t